MNSGYFRDKLAGYKGHWIIWCVVLDCPNIYFLNALVNAEVFKKHQIGALDPDIPKYILHFTKKEVMEDERLV